MAGVQIDGVNNKIDFDDDLDTSISANTDDTLVIEAGGNTMATITATTFTINDGTTITTADNTDTLSLISTDTDDNSGPNLRMYRNSGSPGDNYVIGQIQFEGKNDAAQDVVYNDISMKIADASDGTEDGIIRFRNMQAGTLRQYISTSGTEVVINEDSVDLDFRVESNGNSHMIFVDGGNNRMHIGAATNGNGTLNIENASNADTLVLVSTDADATSGPVLKLFRNSSSPADSDDVGKILFTAENDASEAIDYGTIRGDLLDVTDGTEDGVIKIEAILAGTNREMIRLGNGEGVIVNEDGIAGIDFRVESDGVSHMLFVNGGGNNVGVGTTGDVLGRFHVMNGDTGASADGGGDELVLEHDSACGMTILCPSNQEGGIKFGDPDDNDAGRIQYDHPNDKMFFMTSGNVHFNIASNGDLTATDTSIGSLSDQRLKKDIVNFTYDINKFKQLKPRSFEWKNKSEHGDKTGLRGFIAQEVDSIDNHFVNSKPIKESYHPLDFVLLDDAGTFTETKEYSISEELNNQIPSGKKVGDKYEVTSNKERTTYDSKLGDKDAMYISIIQQLITRIEVLEG
jgi:hypothetical protein